jgi:hypothetical protein
MLNYRLGLVVDPALFPARRPQGLKRNCPRKDWGAVPDDAPE